MIALLAALAVGATPAVDDHPLVRALRDELVRSKERLELPGMPKPYYLAFAVQEYDFLFVSASRGALVGTGHSRRRLMRARVRVGDASLDSSNFVVTSASFDRSPLEWIPVDDDYDALRREMWLAADRAYKEAVGALEAKRAARKEETAEADTPPDFASEPPARIVTDVRAVPAFEPGRIEALARRLSAVFREFPGVQADRVTVSAAVVRRTFAASDGTLGVEPSVQVRLDVTGAAQSDDGMALEDFASFYATSLEELPREADLAREVRRVADELTRLRKAPVVEDYTGPVLFEGRAAPQLFQSMLAGALSGTPPAASDSRMFGRAGRDTELASKLGRRVLPKGFRVEDDPGLGSYKGASLAGTYRFDDEGVPGRKVVLVTDGMLKAFLMSRTPRKGVAASNGHGRATVGGDPRGHVGNLVITAPAASALSPAGLRRQLVALAKAEGLPYAMVVRLLDDSALTRPVVDELGGGSGDRSGGGLRPLVVLRISHDGKEELVRGATLGPVRLRELKEIAAAGNDGVVLNYSGSGWGGASGPGVAPAFTIPSSVVAPPLILKEIDLKKPTEPQRRPPLLAPPSKDKG